MSAESPGRGVYAEAGAEEPGMIQVQKMKDTYILIFQNRKTGEDFDIEVPKTITANELIVSLNKGIGLEMNLEDAANCFLRSENPIALLKGDMMLEEYQLHDGSVVWYGGTGNE